MTRRTKRAKRNMINKAVIYVIVCLAGLWGFGHIRSYVPEGQKEAREVIKEARRSLVKIEVTDDIEHNAEQKATLDDLKQKLAMVSDRFAEEHEESLKLISEIENKHRKLELKNSELHTAKEADSCFNRIEKQVSNGTLSYTQGIFELHQLQLRYPSSNVSDKAVQKIREFESLMRTGEEEIITEAMQRAAKLLSLDQFRAAKEIIEECSGKEFAKVSRDKHDKLEEFRKNIVKKAEEYFSCKVEEAIKNVRSGDGKEAKKGLAIEYEKIGFVSLRGTYKEAIERIDRIQAARMVRAREEIHRELENVEQLTKKRLYEEASRVYKSLMKNVNEPELKKEIEGKQSLNDLMVKVKAGIIRYVNSQGSISLPGLGNIQKMSQEKVYIQMEGKGMGITWDRIRNSEMLVLIRYTLKKNPEAELYTAYGILELEKGNEGEADENFMKALSLKPEICSRFPGLFSLSQIRIAKKIEEQEKRETERKRKQTGMPKCIRIRGSQHTPVWARAEFDAFREMEKTFTLFIDTLVKDDLVVGLKETRGRAYDDIAEVIAIWDKYLLLAGSEYLQKKYVAMCERLHRFCNEKGYLASGMLTKGNDAQHAMEYYMSPWSAIEIDPENEYLVSETVKLADYVLSERIYNSKTRLLRSCWPTAGGYRQGAGLDGDYSPNVFYMTPVFKAYLSTGKEKYKRWLFEYGASWAELAQKNNGIIPYQVDHKTREIGPWSNGKWYKGPLDKYKAMGGGYDFNWDIRYFSYAEDGFALWGRSWKAYPFILTVLDGGKNAAEYAKPVWNTIKAFFESRDDGLPNFRRSDSGWERTNDGNSYVPMLLSNLYATAFDNECYERIRSYARAARALRADDRRMLMYPEFLYLNGGSLSDVVNELNMNKELLEKTRENIRATGGKLTFKVEDWNWFRQKFRPDTRGLAYIDGSLWGPSWKRMIRWGSPSTASIRYFHAQGRCGLPQGVAALVRHIGKNELRIFLYNDNNTSTRVLLTAGHYGQHRFETLNGMVIREHRVLVEIPPKSQAKLDFILTRYAYPATLKPYKAR